MKSLREIISPLKLTCIGLADQVIQDVTLDSRTVKTGCLYAAIKGTQVDGHSFIEKAIEAGACAILHESPLTHFKEGVCYIQVENVSIALGQILYEFQDRCLDDLVIVGTTGTNGKTTVSTLLFDLFTQLGYRCGLISTVSYRIAEATVTSTHTTPDAVSLHRLFKQMHDEGCTHVFMEVSSHAIHQHRIAGIPFSGEFSLISHTTIWIIMEPLVNTSKPKKCFLTDWVLRHLASRTKTIAMGWSCYKTPFLHAIRMD